MSIGVTIDMEGLDALDARIDRLAGMDVRQLLDDVGDYAVSSAGGRLRDGKRGPDGQAWAPWSQRYAARPRKKGGPNTVRGLLNRDGELYSTLTHNLLSGDRVEVGSNLPYAGVHQLGSKRSTGRGGGIPARPYLGVDAEDEREIGLLAEQFISDLLQ